MTTDYYSFTETKMDFTDCDWSCVETHTTMRDGYVTFREPDDYSTIHSGNSNLIWDVLFELPNGNKAILCKVDIRLLGIYSKKEYTGIGTNDSNVIWLESKEIAKNIYKSIQTLRDICLMYEAYCHY
jgi:hypothetical protein